MVFTKTCDWKKKLYWRKLRRFHHIKQSRRFNIFSTFYICYKNINNTFFFMLNKNNFLILPNTSDIWTFSPKSKAFHNWIESCLRTVYFFWKSKRQCGRIEKNDVAEKWLNIVLSKFVKEKSNWFRI